jgi:RNA recognition motif-containing protein
MLPLGRFNKSFRPLFQDKVVAAGEHAINSKKVDVKRAKAKPGKIFVGGLKADLTDDMLKEYFGQVSILLILILRENF